MPRPGHWCAGGFCPYGPQVSINQLLPGDCDCQDAVRTLNTLQTNAGYLEQVKRQRGDPQTQLEAMKLYLARSGLQVGWPGPVTTHHSLSPVAEVGLCLSVCLRWRTWTG